MNTVAAIHTVMNFLEDKVCPYVQFLVPSKDDAKEYIEQYAHPKVFAFFEPAKGRVPNGVLYTTPNVAVQLQSGSDDVDANEQFYNFVLAFSIWRPGDYNKLKEVELESPGILEEEEVKISYKAEKERSYIRNEDGWKDVYHFLDETKNAIIYDGQIGNLKLKTSVPIKYGPYSKDGAIVDFYPYYHAWMSFTLQEIVTPVSRNIDKFL